MGVPIHPHSTREARAFGVLGALAGVALVAIGHPAAALAGITLYLVGLLATRHARFLAGRD